MERNLAHIALSCYDFEDGGIARVAAYLAEGFCREGHKVSLLLCSPHGDLDAHFRQKLMGQQSGEPQSGEPQSNGRESGGGVEIVTLNQRAHQSRAWGQIVNIGAMRRWINAERPDVLLSTSNNMCWVTCASWALAKRDILKGGATQGSESSSVKIPEFYIKTTNPILRKNDGALLRKLRHFGYGKAFGASAKVLTLSHAESGLLSEQFPKQASKFHSVYNPYLTQAFVSKQIADADADADADAGTVAGAGAGADASTDADAGGGASAGASEGAGTGASGRAECEPSAVSLSNHPDTSNPSSSSRSYSPSSLSSPSAGPVIIGIGRLAPQKNFFRAIRAFAAARQSALAQGQDEWNSAKLLIVGEGPQRAELEQLARAQNVADQVDLIGFAHNVPELLRGADLFLLSSEYEGLPAVVIEALGSGCGVVSTDCFPAAREILTGLPNCRVTCEDAEALSTAMLSALEDRPAPETLRACALNYSVDSSVQSHLQAMGF